MELIGKKHLGPVVQTMILDNISLKFQILIIFEIHQYFLLKKCMLYCCFTPTVNI